MTNEIKEILELLREDLYIPQEDNREYKLLDKGDDKLLLDYITNLQERIDKANQLIEKQKKKMYKSRNKIAMYILINLENILRGDE